MIVKKIVKENIDELIAHYKDYEIDCPNNAYIFKTFLKNDTKITVYTNNSKPYCKVTFDGENAEAEANHFSGESKDTKDQAHISKESKEYVFLGDQIGSDEVGAGDFFFPLIIVGVYMKSSDMDIIEEYGIKDSKKMGDKKILEVVPLILDKFEISKLTLPNSKASAMSLHKDENMVSMKVKMHNAADYKLAQSHPLAPTFIDQFVSEKKYYSYLKNEPSVLKNIIFKEKGETFYPSVALASVIARYSLLKYKEKMDEKYGVNFPFGAGENVDKFAIKFAQKFGVDELKKLVKANFSNLSRILDSLGS